MRFKGTVQFDKLKPGSESFFRSTSDSHLNIGVGVEYIAPDYYARATTAVMLIFSSGGVYIYSNSGLTVGNTYTPTLRAYFPGLTFAGQLIITGQGYKPGGGTWADSSDKELKKDIAPMDTKKSLEALLSLPGKNYKWKDESKGTDTEAGFISEDVKKVFPKWVSTGEDGFETVGFYNEFLAYIVEAFREIDGRLQKVEKV